MIRLHLLCEGDTEIAFANIVLRDHLLPLNIHITGLEKTNRTGGFRHFRTVLDVIKLRLKQDRNADFRLSTMIDFYPPRSDMPGFADAMKLHGSLAQCLALEAALKNELNDDRFLPNIQLHEFEALLFANPHQIGTTLNVKGKFDQLVNDCKLCGGPEGVNCGQHSAPSKRIANVVDPFDKPDGALVAADIGLSALRAECPHFNSWITTLEQPGNSHLQSTVSITRVLPIGKFR